MWMRSWCFGVALAACSAHPPVAHSRTPKIVESRLTFPSAEDYVGHDWRDSPSAPLDIVAWLDDRFCPRHLECSYQSPFDEPTDLPSRPVIMRTHRLRGPPDLDAEIAASDAETRRCFLSHSKHGATSPRVASTLLPRRDAPPLVAIEPPDVPLGLQSCLRDVMSDIRTFAPAAVVVIAGAP